MFDDLKQDDNQVTPTPAVPSSGQGVQSIAPVQPVAQANKIDDMFGDVDPVAADHGPVDPEKPSAIQSGKIKAVSQTTAVSPEPSAQATQVPPQPVAQQTVQAPNIPPSSPMVLTDDRLPGSMNKIIIAVLVFLLLAVVSGAVYYFFLKDRGLESVIEGNTNTEVSLNENSNEEENIDDEPFINEDDLDDDSDGLSNGLEKIYGTNPLEADTDNDGIFDQDEIELYHTDPLIADTDGDGLNDYEEIIIYKTKADDPDTDGDGYQDGAEVNNGYNPLGSGKLNENL